MSPAGSLAEITTWQRAVDALPDPSGLSSSCATSRYNDETAVPNIRLETSSAAPRPEAPARVLWTRGSPRFSKDTFPFEGARCAAPRRRDGLGSVGLELITR